jgi:hypothetical protein
MANIKFKNRIMEIERGSTRNHCFGRGYGPVVRQKTQKMVYSLAKIMQTYDSNEIIYDEQFTLCRS